ncbi:hypothetical protein EAW52_10830 [Pseudomonas sp. LTJR-52]|nr:hypothetical protein EAW52_10830 [Pseudomonas sp. LTJR-52]
MLNLDEYQRQYMNELRMLTTDLEGNEVIVGLTVEESKKYLLLNPLMQDSHQSDEEGDEYLRLHEKHEIARREMVLAENEARRNTSPRH